MARPSGAARLEDRVVNNHPGTIRIDICYLDDTTSPHILLKTDSPGLLAEGADWNSQY